jgi:hypothetical protein
MMAGGAADLFQVVVFPPRPDAFLGAACPDVVAFFQAEENILELVHPGIGEEERRVIMGNNAGTRDDGMSTVMKKLEKFCPDFVTCHENPYILKCANTKSQISKNIKKSYYKFIIYRLYEICRFGIWNMFFI